MKKEMAYKKYFYRDGKKFGPYYYESYRVNGKVKKKYLGTTDPDLKVTPTKNPVLFLILGVFILMIFISLYLVSMRSIFTGLAINQNEKVIEKYDSAKVDLNIVKPTSKNKILDFQTGESRIRLSFDLMNYSEFVFNVVESESKLQSLDDISNRAIINSVNELNKEEVKKIANESTTLAEDFDVEINNVPKDTEIINQNNANNVLENENEYKWGYKVKLKELNFMAKIDVSSKEDIKIIDHKTLKIGNNILSFDDLEKQGYVVSMNKPEKLFETDLSFIKQSDEENNNLSLESEDLNETINESNILTNESYDIINNSNENNFSEFNQSINNSLSSDLNEVNNISNSDIINNSNDENNSNDIRNVEEDFNNSNSENNNNNNNNNNQEENLESITPTENINEPSLSEESNSESDNSNNNNVIEVQSNLIGFLLRSTKGITLFSIYPLENENQISVYIQKDFRNTGYQVGDLIDLDPRLYVLDGSTLSLSYNSPPTPLDLANKSNSAIVGISSDNNNSFHSVFVDFDNTLLSWYRFNYDGDSLDHKLGFNNLSCSDTHCPSYTSEGVLGGAYSFDGSDDYFTTGKNPDEFGISYTSGSYSAWVNPLNLSKGSYQSVISGGGRTHLGINASGNFNAGYYINDWLYIGSSDIISEGNWYNLVTVWNLSGKYLYVNGVLKSSNPDSTAWVSTADWGFDIGAASTLDNLLLVNQFQGKIDDILIFNRSLSPEEILSIYNATANQYYNNFSGFGLGNHSFQGFGQNGIGNVTILSTRSFNALDCSEFSYCNGNGYCNEDALCSCNSDYYGSSCSTYCHRINSCNDHGSCNINGGCTCDSGWAGDSCNSNENEYYCSSHGTWNGSTCSCDGNYYGGSCNIYCDSYTCNSHGSCNINGGCDCSYGYAGDVCSFTENEYYCSNQGTWNGSTCSCNENWHGSDCSLNNDQFFCSSQGSWTGTYCSCNSGYSLSDCSRNDRNYYCSGNGNWNGMDFCTCDSGYSLDNCSRNNREYYCSNQGTWDGFTCSCDSGFAGLDCSEVIDCSSLGDCNSNGVCVGLNVCNCSLGWHGSDCTVNDNQYYCSNQGTWGGEICTCLEGWYSNNCSLNDTQYYCLSHGTWNGESCTCDSGWNLGDCSLNDTQYYCSSHGTWDGNNCTCDSGWNTNDCSVSDRNYYCSGNGDWNSTDCVCDLEYFSTNCSIYCSSSSTCNNNGVCLNNGSCECNGGFLGNNCNIVDSYSDISFFYPTPDDGYFLDSNSITINLSSADSLYNYTTVVDFNHSLVGWYRFNYDSDIYDYSSYSNNGTNNGAVYNESGNFGGSYSFDGTDDNITASDSNLPMGDNPGSEFAWIKTSSTTGNHAIAGYGAMSSNQCRWLHLVDGKAYFTSYDNDISNSEGPVISDDNWHFVGYVYYGNKNVTIYVDGVVYNYELTNLLDTNSNLFTIGMFPYNGADTDWFNGSIDDVQIYNRALGVDEIASIYNSNINKYYHTFSNLAPGNYTFKAYAQNILGNVNSTLEKSAYVMNFIDNCSNLSIENGLYALSSDIINNQIGDNCIIISVPNITLDCKGHSIFSNQNYAGIFSDQFNTTIKNCTISMGDSDNYDSIGIKLINSNSSNILYNNLNDNNIGIYFENVSDSIIDSNLINSSISSNGYGILLFNSSFNNLTNNNVNFNYSSVKISFNSTNNLIESNNFSCVYFNCLSILEGSNDNLILRNYIFNNQSSGIVIDNSYRNNLSQEDLITISGNNVLIINSSDSNIDNINSSGLSSGSIGLYFVNATNTNISDCRSLSGVLYDVYINSSTNGTSAYFVNCSYDISKEFVNYGNELTKSWYYSAYTYDHHGNPVSDVNLKIFNVTGDNLINITSNSSGYTNITNIIDYFNNGDRSFYSNYTINASNGSMGVVKSFNISYLLNSYNYPLLLDLICSENYYGETCDNFCEEVVTCKSHGSCNSSGSCVCNPGYNGIQCNDINPGNINSCGDFSLTGIYNLTNDINSDSICFNIYSNNSIVYGNNYRVNSSYFVVHNVTNLSLYNLVINNYNISGIIKFINSSAGRISFNSTISGVGNNLFGRNDSDIQIRNNFIYVNSSVTGLNVGANITFFNLLTNYTRPGIYRDGIRCTNCINYTSLNAGNVTIYVPSFSGYSIEEINNSAPILYLNSSLHVCEGDSISYLFNVSDSDMDSPSASISPSNIFNLIYVSNVSSTIKSYRIFSGTITKQDIGLNSSKSILENVSMNDGIITNSSLVNITMIKINNAPFITDISDIELTFGNSFNTNVNVSDVEDGDSLSGNLSFNISFNGNTHLFNISSNGNINYSAVSSDIGSYNITICVTDLGINASSYIGLCGQNGSNITSCKSFILRIIHEQESSRSGGGSGSSGGGGGSNATLGYSGNENSGTTTIIGANNSDNPLYLCSNWTNCNAVYNVSDVIDSKIVFSGQQKRSCVNIKTKVVVEDKKVCDSKVKVILRKTQDCFKDTLQVFDEKEELVSRVNYDNQSKKLNIQFLLDSITYCSYCFDNVRDYDETGVDCGGSCGICDRPVKLYFPIWNILGFVCVIVVLVLANAVLFSIARYYELRKELREILELAGFR